MSNPATKTALDAETYLAWEEQQPEKHEYIAGEVFAMVGARRDHVVVSLNLAAALKHRLRGGPCQAYIADLKLRVEAVDAFFYPDVMVSCDERDNTANQFIEYPILIVEVLSESTAAFDRGNKFAAYRTLPSLQEYALVDIESRRIDIFRRGQNNDWLFHAYLPADKQCPFTALELSIPFDEIFENANPELPENDQQSMTGS